MRSLTFGVLGPPRNNPRNKKKYPGQIWVSALPP